jgi:sugar lactone lactonase YvrE
VAPRLLLAAVLAGASVLALAVPAEGREPLDVRVFARVPNPGQPEPVAIGPHRRRIYVGTNQLGKGDADAPSKVFAFSPRGRIRRDYELRGQALSEEHGIQGLAFDGARRLYLLDRSSEPRVVRLNPKTGRQRTYASFRDVPTCSEADRERNCSATVGDQPAAPDYAAFDPDGRLYVTDIEQALVWRVPRRGGRPRVWFTHPDLENIFGPNGIQFLPSGRTLLLAVTATGPGTGDPTSGALYKLRVRRDGRAGRLRLFWRSRPFDGPDGFAISRSGKVYLALAGANQLAVISPQGRELARVPSGPVENATMEIPFDGPASLAFLGRRVLVSNHSPIAGNPRSWAIFDIFAGERGLPLFRPRIPAAR